MKELPVTVKEERGNTEPATKCLPILFANQFLVQERRLLNVSRTLSGLMSGIMENHPNTTKPVLSKL